MLKKLIIFLCLAVSCSLYSNPSSALPDQNYEVLTLSAAIIDHFFSISDAELKAISNEKGGWAPIDYTALRAMMDHGIEVSKMITGGSGANVIKGMAQLGNKCAIIGKVGNDEKGKYYVKKLKDLGIITLFESGTLPTGQAICLITPDGERTFRTYLGASHSLTSLQLKDTIWMENLKLFHIEGYQLVDRDLVIRALKQAKLAGVKISMDLANVDIVRRNKEFIRKILEKYVDIVFCNEREARILTDVCASESCDYLGNLCEIAVVTMSERGSWVRNSEKKIFMEALSVNAIDTTGAGDLYAAGFLHGYLNNAPLKKCAWLGSLVASYVVKRIGAEIPDAVWEEIQEVILSEGKSFDE